MEHVTLTGKQLLDRLVGTDRFRALFDRFSRLTGYPLRIIRSGDGHVLLRAGGADVCSRFRELCTNIQKICDLRSSGERALVSGPELLRCRSGLVEGIVPVRYEGAIIAEICAGQVFFDREAHDNFSEYCTDCRFEGSDFTRILESVPVIPEAEFTRVLEFLEELSGLILELLSVSAEEKWLEELSNQEMGLRKSVEESERRFLAILETTNDFISTSTPDGRITYINRGGRRMVGIGEDEALDEILIRDLHSESSFSIINDEGIPAAVRDGIWTGETVLLARDGKEIPVSQVILSHRGADGAIEYISTIIRDISAQKAAAAALRQSEEQYRLLTDNSVDIIWIFEMKEGGPVFRYVNPACFKMFGFTPEEMVSIPLRDQVSPEDMETILNAATAILETGEQQVFHYHHRHKNGNWVECEVTAGPYSKFDRNNPVFQGRTVDITERKKIENALRDSEQMFSRFMDFLPASVFIKDADSRLLYTNKFFRDAFRKDSYVGKTARDIFEESIAGKMIEEDQLVLRGETVVNEKTVPHADGILHTYQSYEFLIERQDKPDLIGGISIDITELKSMEVRLRQSEKMESIGTLAGGIAHDFNNLLTGIITAGEMLERRLRNADADGIPFTDIILKASRQAADLTQKLLAFSRKGVVRLEPVDMHSIIQDSITLLKRSIDRRITFYTTLSAEHSVVTGDRAQLQNMIINLGINASHAMPGGGKVCISSAVVGLDAGHCGSSSFEIEPGDYFELAVSDQGHGIPESDLGRIFEPFFTTKAMGTGLGLSAVYGSVQDHHGEITVESRENEWTVFRIRIPLSRDSIDEEKAGETPVAGSGTILLVDDEEVIRQTGQSMLESLGYTILLAENGEQALAIFREKREKIDLVLLDMIMPGMNGREVFTELKAVSPDIRVAVSSGYSTGDDLERLFDEGVVGFISKPYTFAELSRRIQEFLK